MDPISRQKEKIARETALEETALPSKLSSYWLHRSKPYSLCRSKLDSRQRFRS